MELSLPLSVHNVKCMDKCPNWYIPGSDYYAFKIKNNTFFQMGTVAFKVSIQY